MVRTHVRRGAGAACLGTAGDRHVALWSIHNFELGQGTLHGIAAVLQGDFDAGRAAPLLQVTFVGIFPIIARRAAMLSMAYHAIKGLGGRPLARQLRLAALLESALWATRPSGARPGVAQQPAGPG